MCHFWFCIHRYSGEMRDVGQYIDEAANIIWENVSIFPSINIYLFYFGTFFNKMTNKLRLFRNVGV